MSRRLNFTKRQRIHQDEVDLRISPSAKTLTVEAAIDLTRLIKSGLLPDFPIFLEAYHEPRRQRIPLGTVGDLAGARRVEVPDFNRDEPVLFRLKIVDTAIEGRIAAFCDQIRPRPPGEHETESLLPIKIAPLEGEVFRLKLPDSSGEEPVLILNEGLDIWMIGGIKPYARTPLFVSLVLPSVIRQVLTHYLRPECEMDSEDDQSQPRGRWLAFGARLTGVEPPDTSTELAEVYGWVDDAVEAFCQNLSLLDRFKTAAESK